MKLTRTKIVATVGPACGTPKMIRELVTAGVDVFRLNFSHGDHESHARYIEIIRKAAADAQAPVAVMQDLQGPRIRTGALRDHKPVRLKEHAEVTLRPGDFEGDAETVAVNYGPLAAEAKEGDSILLSDGLIELSVISTDGKQVRCKVTSGGKLGEHKGINLPGVRLSIASPTEKDIADLHFGIEHEVDFVALSFVRSADDVIRLKKAMREDQPSRGQSTNIPVIVKVEKPEAVTHLHEILRVAEGVMVARGDLGIEMPTESVPAVQKKILRMANQLGVPAITATQMLKSMVRSPRPTRAEATDVANAILDGTDAVMLSAETIRRALPGQGRAHDGQDCPGDRATALGGARRRAAGGRIGRQPAAARAGGRRLRDRTRAGRGRHRAVHADGRHGALHLATAAGRAHLRPDAEPADLSPRDAALGRAPGDARRVREHGRDD